MTSIPAAWNCWTILLNSATCSPAEPDDEYRAAGAKNPSVLYPQ
jgi:hypothetical protein